MQLLLFNLATDVNDPILGFTTSWIRALAERVDFVHVITMRAGKVEVPNNVQVHSVGKEKEYSEPRRAVEFYRHLFRILGEQRVDVCFSHMIPMFTVLAAPVLRPRGVPIVTWYAHRQVSTILKLAHHLSDRMVSVDKGSYRYDCDKVALLGHGIDTDLISPDGTPPPSPPLLLSVGRVSPIKDPVTLLRAVHLLVQEGLAVRCVLVGEPPERDRVYAEQALRLVKDLGLDRVVRFVGAVPHECVVGWYRRCFAHVNCGPGDNALDKAVLEAMACGRPSLSSIQGFRETMGRWADPLVFGPGDAVGLAQKLKDLLRASPGVLSLMARDLRQSVVEGHSLGQLADGLVALFKALG